ncbi:MAG: CYTH domain-containing protein, partial [Victivallaceae bacterium]
WKFLVNNQSWLEAAISATPMRQGYICSSVRATARIRIVGKKAFITLKGRVSSLSRHEFEYEIPLADGETMLAQMCGNVICKTRYTVPYAGKNWEVDVFEGDNTGLIVAELEVEQENEIFARPPWLGKNVTTDPRYSNSLLAQNPYKNWKSDK